MSVRLARNPRSASPERAFSFAGIRSREQERIVQPFRLLLDRLHAPVLVDVRSFASARRCSHTKENPVIDQAHVAGGRLQSASSSVNARSSVALLTLTPDTGAGNGTRSSSRSRIGPAAGQRSPAGFAPHEAAQREVRMVALARGGHADR